MTKKVRLLVRYCGKGMLPRYASEGAAGADVYAANEEPVEIFPGQIVLIPTALQIDIPQGYEIQIRPRSGLSLKSGITLVNSPGTIDSDFRGEIGLIVINHGKHLFIVEPGMRLAQMVLAKVEQAEFIAVEELSETTRGSQGFGHTGVF